MLFLPLACIVRERAPDWPVLPAAKNMAVSCTTETCHVRGDQLNCSSSPHHVVEQVVVGILAIVVPRSHVGRSPRVGADARPSQAPWVVEWSCSGNAETRARLPQVHH